MPFTMAWASAAPIESSEPGDALRNGSTARDTGCVTAAALSGAAPGGKFQYAIPAVVATSTTAAAANHVRLREASATGRLDVAGADRGIVPAPNARDVAACPSAATASRSASRSCVR